MEKVIFRKGRVIENNVTRVTNPNLYYIQYLKIWEFPFKTYTCRWDAHDNKDTFGIGQKVNFWTVEGGEDKGIVKLESR